MHLKTIITIIIIIFLISGNLSAQSRTTMAVLPLESLGLSGQEAEVLANRLRSLLVNIGNYDVVDRSRMEEILTEQGFQQTGCTSDECVVEAGKLLGVQKMLAGSIGKFGSVYTLELRIIDVETGRIESTASYDYKVELENILLEGAETALRKLLGIEGQESTSQQFGSLVVLSEPSGAKIFLDGAAESVTPRTIKSLPVGKHEISIKKDGFREEKKQVQITPNTSDTLHFKLSSDNAYLEIICNPIEAELYINFQSVGKGTFIGEKMNAGQYVIEAKHDFYSPYQEVIDLSPADTVVKRIKLAPALGYLSLVGKPVNAAVLISDGQNENQYALSQVTNMQMPAGYYDLEVKAPFYFPYKNRIKLTAEDKTPLEINLKFGGDELKKIKKQRNWLNLGAAAGVGLTVGTMLIANSMYDKYQNAKTTSRAEDYRKKTELYDTIAFGFSLVTLSVSTYSLYKWYKESKLRKTLGLK